MNSANALRLQVHPVFRAFVEQEMLAGLELSADDFWMGLQAIIDELTPENRDLLEERRRLQVEIDAYHVERASQVWDATDYKAFLKDIGYLEPLVDPFSITTNNVDPEIAQVAGPQLVVPVSNARFALNAANARWGSLYDALYGTDVIDSSDGRAAGSDYNPVRGAAVIARACEFLDSAVPLATGCYADVGSFEIRPAAEQAQLRFSLGDGRVTSLRDESQFVGHTDRDGKRRVLLRNNQLHIEIQVDAQHPIGKAAPGGMADIVLESAVTTIQDCEDSVAAVDADDKTAVYRNWLGLMRANLTASFEKSGKTLTRRMNADREYIGADGSPLRLPGRSLMLVRNVGHLMQTDAVLDAQGEEVFEGILDAVITTGCALHDLRGEGAGSNSRCGSIYIVKPKMHGSREAAFADRLFARVEDLYGLARDTLKIGVMDEERRTSANLANCIAAVQSRLVFINTGFLDRTGDEIHTSMKAGAMLPKEAIKEAPWIAAYEDRNVDTGIRCGLPGRAQIGKGMWPKPDEMQQMLDSKLAHLEAGANCAWVPSPTAATLHAMHYHQLSVASQQRSLAERQMASIDTLLTPPFGASETLSNADVQSELDNNAQGILGYVVRWIDQGVGCSKVPDINNTGLMEDRATLRISSQHIANWLHHGICTEQQVIATFRRMAAVVDEQNAGDPNYENMADNLDRSLAFAAACDLALKGAAQPNGYTEPLLHEYRRKRKA